MGTAKKGGSSWVVCHLCRSPLSVTLPKSGLPRVRSREEWGKGRQAQEVGVSGVGDGVTGRRGELVGAETGGHVYEGGTTTYVGCYTKGLLWLATTGLFFPTHTPRGV